MNERTPDVVLAQLREEITHVNGRLSRAQDELLKELTEGYRVLSQYTAQRVWELQAKTNLWNNVGIVLERWERRDKRPLLSEVLQAIIERVEDELFRYTAPHSTSVLSILDENLRQEARVEFRQDMQRWLRVAKRAEKAVEDAETALVLEQAADMEA